MPTREYQMSNVFLIGDTHFGHVGVTQFLRSDGAKLRPWDTVQEMDEALVANWNSVVRPQDKVYHLGDVVINRRALATLGRLNGTKVLIKGNHDIFRAAEYLAYFKDIRAYHILSGLVCSHVPLHPSAFTRWKANVHAHTHSNRVMLESGEIDTRYRCVSVEHINFTPISLEEIKKGC